MTPSPVRRPHVPAPLDGDDGFQQRSFALTLDQRFLAPSQSHTAVLNEIRRALQEREGLVVVTGAPGSGKTLLCRTLLQELDPGVCASVVLDPRVTIDDLLLHILNDFGVISSPRQLALAGAPTRDQLMRALQHFLASLIPVWGCAVLVIDEAQDLDPEVLEQLQMLLGFQADQAKLLQVVLVGLPELNELLRHRALHQLDACVARQFELEASSVTEIAPYVADRMAAVESPTDVIDVTVLEAEDIDADRPLSTLALAPPAAGMLTTPSRGVLRAIDVLRERALEIGQKHRTYRVDWRIACAAGRGVRVMQSAPSRMRTTAKVALAAAIVFMLAVLGFGMGSLGARPTLPEAPPAPPFARLDSQRMLSSSIDVKSLPGVDSFNIRVASFRAAAGAAALAEQLEAAGLPAFIRVERGSLHQVIVGPYLSHAEIAGVQSRLARYGHPTRDVFVEYFEAAGALAGAENPRALMARSQALQR
ncbi:MAG TPA: AAA family ATPase [Vicinamibacterales bacterium]